MAISGDQPAYMTARSGYLRSGAGRSGDYDHFWIVKIAGTNRTATHQIQPGTSVTLNKAGEPSTAKFRTVGFTPVEGQPVSIASGAADHLVFSGTILRLSQVPVPAAGKNMWDVECIDLSFKLNERRVFREYPAFYEPNIDWFPDTIIKDLVNTFSPTGLFTTQHVTGLGVTPMAIVFEGETVLEAIQKVVGQTGGESFIDPNGDIWAYLTHPWTPVQVDLGAKPRFNYGTLTYQRDVAQARTRALVKAARTTIVADYDTDSGATENTVPLHDFVPFLTSQTFGGASYGTFDAWFRHQRYVNVACATGANSQVTTTTSAVSPGATTVAINDANFFIFGLSSNWLTDGQQYFYFHDITAGVTLTGIPASGPGSITAAIPSGTTLRSVPQAKFTGSPPPAGLVPAGTEIALCVLLINAAAEASFAALLNDGTHPSVGRIETFIDDDKLLYAAALDVAFGAITNFGQVGVAGTFEDFPSIIARPGQRIYANISARGISVTAKITRVTMKTRGDAGIGRPVGTVDFSTRTELRAFSVL